MPKCVIIVVYIEIIEEYHLVNEWLVYTLHNIMLVYLGLHYCLVFNCECGMDAVIFGVQEVG